MSERGAPSTIRTFRSRHAYNQFVNGGLPPTADDCTVLEDGTRIDSAAKARAYMQQLRDESTASYKRDAAHETAACIDSQITE